MMKQQNKWESLFEDFLEVTEFRLIKYKTTEDEYNPWRWGVYDKQGEEYLFVERQGYCAINAEHYCEQAALRDHA